MTVQEIMTQPVHTCTVDMNLAAASRRMRATGCGALVVLRHGRLAGVVTDRDLALAIGDISEPAHVPVGEIMTRQVRTCQSTDDVRTALDAMARFKVRRLPVFGISGDVDGLISVDDIILWAMPEAAIEPSVLTDALRSLCSASTAAVHP
jgi:CBS domain-containing protein